MKCYSLDEVVKHDNLESLWIIRDNSIYDVTKFISKHPGGKVFLLNNAKGKDVNHLMKGEPHHHTPTAFKMMEKFKIGSILENDNLQNGHENKITNNSIINSNSLDIDIHKAMIGQIGKLGRFYKNWIHTFEDVDLRFFNTNFLEKFTICKWYVVPIFWIPIMLYLLYLSSYTFLSIGSEQVFFFNVSSKSMPLLFLFGVLLWTLLEYVIHRWVFHLDPPQNSKFLITIHFLFHGQHHKNPMNKNRLVFPPVPAMPFAFAIFFFFNSILPTATTYCVLAGVILGYISYDLIHYYLHHGNPTSKYWKHLKNHHMKHHYMDSLYGFGISSTLWDYFFRTNFPEKFNLKDE